MVFDPWVFVGLVALASACGAAIAARFDGVVLAPDRFAIAVAVPSALAVIFSGVGVQVEIAMSTYLFVAALSCLAVVDGTTKTVPDIVTIPMIALGILHAYMSGFDVWVFGGFALAIVMLGLLGQYVFPRQSWIGGGDVLLVAGAVAWFGPALLPDLMLLGAGLLCLSLAARSFAKPRPVTCIPGSVPLEPGMPLAPSLGTAQLVVWFGGPLF